jgi:NAD(P)H-hydrate epimerase
MLTRQQVREVDRRAIEEYGMLGLVLMENAGRGVADKLCEWMTGGGSGSATYHRPQASSVTVICCGKGNNGGDGFVVARHLDLRGWPVKVLLFANPEELTGDAAANYHILEKADIPIEAFAESADPERLDRSLAAADWIVDALLGTGATGNPRPPYDQAIERINASGKPVVAIDLPSGLDCDTGEAATPTIRAAQTCTFVAAKPGFFAPGAKAFTGQVHLLDIGAPRKLTEKILNRASRPA